MAETNEQPQDYTLRAYNTRTKEKGVAIVDAVVSRTSKGFIVKGTDGNGSNLSALVGKEKAKLAVENGTASLAEGVSFD